MGIKAVIFDMDGVLIDSEHLWRKAMIKGFADFKMPISEEECRRTMGMRFREVITLWLKHFQFGDLDVRTIEDHVVKILIDLIKTEGQFIAGIPEVLKICNERQLLTGLATSSSEILMNTVLDKLKLRNAIKECVSAEHLLHGKPHPEVFLICAQKLGVETQDCLVIEDSLNGVIAAKAAQMQVVAVPDDDHRDMKQFALADFRVEKMTALPDLLLKLLEI